MTSSVTSTTGPPITGDVNEHPKMPDMKHVPSYQNGNALRTNGHALCEFVETDLDEDLDEVDGHQDITDNRCRTDGQRELWRRPSYRTALENRGSGSENGETDSEVDDLNLSYSVKKINGPIKALGDLNSAGRAGQIQKSLDPRNISLRKNSVDSENEINVDTGVEVRSLENMSTASSSLLSLSSIGSDNSSSVGSKVKVTRDEKQTRERNIIKHAHISNEYVRLTELLDVINPYELREALKTMLQSKDPKLVVALTTLLPRRAYPVHTVAHCARCHKTYNPQLPSNCVLRHPNSKVTKLCENPDGATFHCNACSRDFSLVKMHFYDEAVNSYLSGLCFQGRHTTNPREVAFGGAAKPCDVMGCLECYV